MEGWDFGGKRLSNLTHQSNHASSSARGGSYKHQDEAKKLVCLCVCVCVCVHMAG